MTYTITHDLTNITKGNMTFVITPSEGYELPKSANDIIVTNGTLISYDNTTGTIVVSGDDTTTVSVTCEEDIGDEPFLTFESDDGSEFTLGTDANSPGYWSYYFGSDGTFEYSTDKTHWNSWNPGTTISSSNGKLYLRGTGNTYLSVYNSSCFLPGTKITLADGTQKNVEDITYEDQIKVWDFDNGCYSTASICWLTKPKLKNYHYYELTFSDGTILKTTGEKSNHKIYNVDERYFKGVNVTEVGDRVFSENGIVTVTNKRYVVEEVLYFNLITAYKFGCFANGILTSDRYGNLYPIDENMMFIKGDRKIRPYSEFEAEDIAHYWYDVLRLGENTETMESTKEYIDKLKRQMRLEEAN